MKGGGCGVFQLPFWFGRVQKGWIDGWYNICIYILNLEKVLMLMLMNFLIELSKRLNSYLQSL